MNDSVPQPHTCPTCGQPHFLMCYACQCKFKLDKVGIPNRTFIKHFFGCVELHKRFPATYKNVVQRLKKLSGKKGRANQGSMENRLKLLSAEGWAVIQYCRCQAFVTHGPVQKSARPLAIKRKRENEPPLMECYDDRFTQKLAQPPTVKRKRGTEPPLTECYEDGLMLMIEESPQCETEPSLMKSYEDGLMLMMVESPQWKHYATIAILEGNIKLLEWFSVKNVWWPPRAELRAVPDVKALEKKKFIEDGKKICCLAALGERMDVLKWARVQQRLEWDEDVLTIAVRIGNPSMVAWLLQHNCPTPRSIEKTLQYDLKFVSSLNNLFDHGEPLDFCSIAEKIQNDEKLQRGKLLRIAPPMVLDETVLAWALQKDFSRCSNG